MCKDQSSDEYKGKNKNREAASDQAEGEHGGNLEHMLEVNRELNVKDPFFAVANLNMSFFVLIGI